MGAKKRAVHFWCLYIVRGLPATGPKTGYSRSCHSTYFGLSTFEVQVVISFSAVWEFSKEAGKLFHGVTELNVINSQLHVLCTALPETLSFRASHTKLNGRTTIEMVWPA